MGKTFDQSLIDVAKIPMSMIDVEDISDTGSEEFEGLRRVQQGCHTELTNREDFPFNKFLTTIETIQGQSEYNFVDGTVTSMYIHNSRTPLRYNSFLKLADEHEGTPTQYGFEYNPDKIILSPVPDKAITIDVYYNDTKNVIDAQGNPSFEITLGSKLRMPERVQHLYFDALEYYVLTDYMRKISNPRWQPTYEIFKNRWQIFLRGSRTTDTETRFTL